MNANDIKWITSGNLEHDPFYFSIPEKLEKFGYCIDMSGYGEGKSDKAQLCIIDTVNKKEDPNILIICPDGRKESWYLSLLKGVGLEFKFVNAARDSVMFFSPETSNLMLLDEKVLAEGEGSAFTPIKNSGILWDLVIIDASGSVDGIIPALYTDNLGMKTEKLLVFAPYPSEYTTAPEGIRDIVKALLSDDAKAKTIDDYNIDETVMQFTMGSPLVNYPRETYDGNTVKVVNYVFPESDIPQNLHIEDQAGSRYSHGGNVFEEYNLPERSIYQKPIFTRSDAETLKNKDKKLEKFLGVIDEIMNSDDKTAVVYFKSDATVDYIEKVLTSIYFDKSSGILFLDKTRFDIKMMKEWYETVPSSRIRVILAGDKLSENIGVFTPITHIINYELPDSPVELQQRYMRRSLSPKQGKPEFIMFLDENGLFDSRVLGKALAGNLYKAFRMNVPSENILFSVPGIEVMLSEMIADIKYIADYTGAVGSSFDIISRFRTEYNIPAARNITTAARTHEYSQRKVETLAKALGVGDMINEKEIDKASLLMKITQKVEQIRSGFSWFDKDMAIKTLPRKTTRTDEFKQFAGYLDGNPFNLGLNNARKELKSAVEGKNGFAYIKDTVGEIPDAMKPAVLYNIWIYWHKDLGIGGSYAEFIKAYNEGVI
ncbi:MAG: hypothetical protein IJT87_07970 [Ruminiclostridium sp.]|nr:hypothetical protein [Ruminiclostridium sp.]